MNRIGDQLTGDFIDRYVRRDEAADQLLFHLHHGQTGRRRTEIGGTAHSS